MKQLHSLDYSEEPSSSDTSTADASAYALVAVGSNINRPVIPTLKPGQQQNSGAVDEWVPRTLACTQDTCGAAAVLSLTVALAAVQPDGVPDSLLRLISPFRSHHDPLQVLGKGGFGSVSLVQSRLDGKMMAMKTIRFRSTLPPWTHALALENKHKRLLREVRALSNLSWSPYIVKYHSAWIEPDWTRIGTTLVQKAQDNHNLSTLLHQAISQPFGPMYCPDAQPAFHLLSSGAHSNTAHPTHPANARKTHLPAATGFQRKQPAVIITSASDESNQSPSASHALHLDPTLDTSPDDTSRASTDAASHTSSSSSSMGDSEKSAESAVVTNGRQGNQGRGRKWHQTSHSGPTFPPCTIHQIESEPSGCSYEDPHSASSSIDMHHTADHVQVNNSRASTQGADKRTAVAATNRGLSHRQQLSDTDDACTSSSSSSSIASDVVGSCEEDVESDPGSDSADPSDSDLSAYDDANLGEDVSHYSAFTFGHDTQDAGTSTAGMHDQQRTSSGHRGLNTTQDAHNTSFNDGSCTDSDDEFDGSTESDFDGSVSKSEHVSSTKDISRNQTRAGRGFAGHNGRALVCSPTNGFRQGFWKHLPTGGKKARLQHAQHESARAGQGVQGDKVTTICDLAVATGMTSWPYVLYISMEPVAGLTLDKWIAQKAAALQAQRQQQIAGSHDSSHPASSKHVSNSDLPIHLGPMEKEIFLQLAVAVSHVHGAACCHRDIKPANIFTTISQTASQTALNTQLGVPQQASTLGTHAAPGMSHAAASDPCNSQSTSRHQHHHGSAFAVQVKLGDFGLAKLLQEETSGLQSMGSGETASPEDERRRYSLGPLTRRASSLLSTPPSSLHTCGLGTASYAAPEQRRSSGLYDQAVDMYPLGLILLELMCPFTTGMERARTLQSARQGQLPEELVSQYPHEAQLIQALLSDDPRQRPTCTQLISILQHVWQADQTVQSAHTGKQWNGYHANSMTEQAKDDRMHACGNQRGDGLGVGGWGRSGNRTCPPCITERHEEQEEKASCLSGHHSTRFANSTVTAPDVSDHAIPTGKVQTGLRIHSSDSKDGSYTDPSNVRACIDTSEGAPRRSLSLPHAWCRDLVDVGVQTDMCAVDSEQGGLGTAQNAIGSQELQVPKTRNSSGVVFGLSSTEGRSCHTEQAMDQTACCNASHGIPRELYLYRGSWHSGAELLQMLLDRDLQLQELISKGTQHT